MTKTYKKQKKETIHVINTNYIRSISHKQIKQWNVHSSTSSKDIRNLQCGMNREPFYICFFYKIMKSHNKKILKTSVPQEDSIVKATYFTIHFIS